MIPLFSNSQVRGADHFAISKLGIAGNVLMENAARSILSEIENNFENLSEYARFGIICGKGNNGGDGFALARLLMIRGYEVRVVSLSGSKELKGDAKTNYDILNKLSEYYSNSELSIYTSNRDLSKLADCEIIIDCLLGTGTQGELREPYKSIIGKLNALDCYKVAVDIPSGLIEDCASGSSIFNADLTVTLAELKTGLYYGQGFINCGKIVKGSIGTGPEYFDTLEVENYLVEPEDVLRGLPVRQKDAHKYSAGKVLIIGGSAELPGAAILASNAALRSGAGAVILAFPKSITLLAQNKLAEAVVYSYNDKDNGCLSASAVKELQPKINWADCVVIGPGLGRSPESIEAVLNIIKNNNSKRFIIDADALFALSSSNIGSLKLSSCVLTPHYGEFANLIGKSVAELKDDILNNAKNFAKMNKCHLILKGAPTIIFTPQGEAVINTSGNASLAKFGSGDVLAGMLGSFVGCNKEIENSIVSASYIHGLCADLLINRLNEISVNATDLIGTISDAITFIRKSFI